METRPEKAMELAVAGMLPHNTAGKKGFEKAREFTEMQITNTKLRHPLSGNKRKKGDELDNGKMCSITEQAEESLQLQELD